MSDASHSALIVGGQGGIGAALALRWRQSGRFKQVLTSSRNPKGDELPYGLDLLSEASMIEFCHQLEPLVATHSLQSVALCSGLLHNSKIQPERRLAALDAEAFAQVMQVNALGPLLLIKHLLPLLPKKMPTQLLAISARVGSIKDNRLGGWYSYRCSKAALNQGFQTLAVELRRTHPLCVLTLFHPGTVDTQISRPFQDNVPAGKLFEPARAACQLDEVMCARTDPRAHLFVDWAGHEVEY